MTGSGAMRSSFAVLSELARRPETAERCEFCNTQIGPAHEHLVQPDARKLMCVCLSCACLFASSEKTKFRRVPRRVVALGDFKITDAEWDELAIPIGMAFFLKSDAKGSVAAIYPSPAGPVESLLSLAAWDAIAARSLAIRGMVPYVEGVLANRASGEYYLAPIDECYRLTGLIRANWRGLSGGSAVWAEIRSFFEELHRRASPEGANA